MPSWGGDSGDFSWALKPLISHRSKNSYCTKVIPKIKTRLHSVRFENMHLYGFLVRNADLEVKLLYDFQDVCVPVHLFTRHARKPSVCGRLRDSPLIKLRKDFALRPSREDGGGGRGQAYSVYWYIFFTPTQQGRGYRLRRHSRSARRR